MRRLVATLVGAAVFVTVSGLAHAACSLQGSGEVDTISNSFPALDVIATAMRECNGGGVKVITKLTTDNEAETKQALSASRSPYGLVQLTNSTVTPAQAAGQLRPLNDLVAKYKDKYQIEPQMLITSGNDVVAIAFDVNAQNLFYRKDLLDAAGIPVPKTYADVLAAAQKLKGTNGL